MSSSAEGILVAIRLGGAPRRPRRKGVMTSPAIVRKRRRSMTEVGLGAASRPKQRPPLFSNRCMAMKRREREREGREDEARVVVVSVSAQPRQAANAKPAIGTYSIGPTPPPFSCPVPPGFLSVFPFGTVVAADEAAQNHMTS
ncbi:hypothetical protein CDD83_4079 [Cordyceps sp. RAO-2017]|nr:hypothetical protein CDD83_4079 [Cordyceps sp. RAO-2017]